MFALRIITETRENGKLLFKQEVDNHYLGDFYGFRKEFTSEDADSDFNPEDYFGSVVYGNGKRILLNRNSKNTTYLYFIMTGEGSSFEKLRPRD